MWMKRISGATCLQLGFLLDGIGSLVLIKPQAHQWKFCTDLKGIGPGCGKDRQRAIEGR
jgi:hypothetical protein